MRFWFVEETAAREDCPEMFKEAPCRYPEAERFVEETEAREDCPEMLKVPPWRNPEAVRLVPEAEVKARVGNFP